MSFRNAAVATFAALLLCAAALHAQPADTSLAVYRAELQRLAEQVGALNADPAAAQKLRAEIPKALVAVADDGRRFDCSTAWLDRALGEIVTAKPERRAEVAKDIQTRLSLLAEQADIFQHPPPASGARGQLNEILSRREFRFVAGPSAWDLLKARIWAWVFRMLGRIFGRIPSSGFLGEILVWLAIAAGAAILVIWLKRKAASSREEMATREVIPFAPSAKNWRKWLAEARAAASAGDWRNAIHLAYWAGVSQLEESGTWVPDRARTPREYLRLLPELGQRRSALAALTGKFEPVWYGNRAAAAADFSEALAHLELLGCR